MSKYLVRSPHQIFCIREINMFFSPALNLNHQTSVKYCAISSKFLNRQNLRESTELYHFSVQGTEYLSYKSRQTAYCLLTDNEHRSSFIAVLKPYNSYLKLHFMKYIRSYTREIARTALITVLCPDILHPCTAKNCSFKMQLQRFTIRD